MSMRPWARLARITVAGALLASAIGVGAAPFASAQDPRSRTSRKASSTSPWSSSGRTTTAAGARRTTRASSTSARTCRTRTSPTWSWCRRAPTRSRSSAAWRARASTSSSAPPSATWTPWTPSPRSSRTATFLHLTGYKSNGTNFGNFFGAIEDMKYLAGHARRARAPSWTATPRSATWPPSPSRRRSGWATRSCWAPSRPAPSARWTCASSTPGTTRQQERDGAASLFDAGAQVVFTGADTPAVAQVAEEKGKWGVTYDHPGSCTVDALPDGPLLDLGPRVRPHRGAGQGRHVHRGLRVLRRGCRRHGPVRLHGR